MSHGTYDRAIGSTHDPCVTPTTHVSRVALFDIPPTGATGSWNHVTSTHDPRFICDMTHSYVT